jgi:hypothetical protein
MRGVATPRERAVSADTLRLYRADELLPDGYPAAWHDLGLDLPRPEVEAHLDELLALEMRQLALGVVA